MDVLFAGVAVGAASLLLCGVAVTVRIAAWFLWERSGVFLERVSRRLIQSSTGLLLVSFLLGGYACEPYVKPQRRPPTLQRSSEPWIAALDR